MADPIELISSKIVNEKKSVILYGASWNAIFILRELKSRYSIHPSAICDSDPLKQNKEIEGVRILSFDEAVWMYPDAYFYITPLVSKHQIMGQLISDKGISENQILNYEPIEKRISCRLLETTLTSNGNTFQFCCPSFKNLSPLIAYDRGFSAPVEALIRMRDELVYDLNHSVPTPCDGCPNIMEDWFAVNRKVRTLTYGEVGTCNYKCCYCKSITKGNHLVPEAVTLPELITFLKENNILEDDVRIEVACGEISIYPKRKELYKAIRGHFSFLFSNASVYDDEIARLIKEERSVLNTSVDAGTRETYAKVKGYDLFEEVRTNLYRYANEGKKGSVELKYIFMPGINDTPADINGFIELCRYVKPFSVKLSHDMFISGELPKQTVDMAVQLATNLEENGFLFSIISDKINCIWRERRSTCVG